MPRTEQHPHYVSKTRKDHKCEMCGGIIPAGTKDVRYKNLFTGKRAYYHPDYKKDCEPLINAKIQAVIDHNRKLRESSI